MTTHGAMRNFRSLCQGISNNEMNEYKVFIAFTGQGLVLGMQTFVNDRKTRIIMKDFTF